MAIRYKKRPAKSEIKKQVESKEVIRKYKRHDIFDVGDIISITNRSGVIFIGTYKGVAQEILYLIDVKILGKKYRVKTPWILLESNTISHIHPGNVEVLLREDENLD